MAFRYYRLLLDKQPDETQWSSVFPELGVASSGSDVNEAIAQALDAARGWLEVSLERGAVIPDAVGLDAPLPDWMTQDPDVDWSAGARVLVPVDVPDLARAA